MKDVKCPMEVINLLFVSQELSEIIDRSNKMFSTKYNSYDPTKYRDVMSKLCKYYISSIDTTFYWSESLCYIRIKDRLFCAPRCILLMFHNKVCDLLSVLILSMYGEKSSLCTDAPFHVIEFIKEMIALTYRFGNKSYSIFKVLEGIVIAETLVECERWVNQSFFENLCKDLFTGVKF